MDRAYCAQKLYTVLLLCCFFTFSPHTAFCKENEPYRVPHVHEPIRVDGVLDEPVWNNALVLHPDNEFSPGENIPAPVKTDVLLAYNETHLFVAFKAYDPEPSQISAHLSDRDTIWDDDYVYVIFDTFNDQRHAFNFYPSFTVDPSFTIVIWRVFVINKGFTSFFHLKTSCFSEMLPTSIS